MLLILAVTIAGCGEPENAGLIRGCVTDTQGGPAVSGASVVYGEQSGSTRSDGSFRLSVYPGEPHDLIVAKADRGTVRVQGVQAEVGETIVLDIPSRPLFNPEWSSVAPVISVSGIASGADISGTITLGISIAAERPIAVCFAYFCGEQRAPQELVAVKSDSAICTIVSTQFPNGPGYVRILAYDDNGNAAISMIPVSIQNAPDDIAPPESLEAIKVTSYTFGQNMGVYRKNRQEQFCRSGIREDYGTIKLRGGGTLSIRTAPSNSTLYTELSWPHTNGADGYSIHRRLEGGEYRLIANLRRSGTDGSYYDYSSELRPGLKVYYRVVPYNSAGVGIGRDCWVIPLPSYNVQLVSPANGSTEAPFIDPGFTWRRTTSGTMPANVSYWDCLCIFDASSTLIYDSESETSLYDCTELQLYGALNPGGTYSWDIYYSDALAVYVVNDFTLSCAYSFAGAGSGSSNGEFVFTTTTSIH